MEWNDLKEAQQIMSELDKILGEITIKTLS